MTKNSLPQKELDISPIVGWWIWGVAALFYGYEFIHRIMPAAMLPELKLAFHVSATTLGSFSAIYFWTYALFQIPAGMLIDRFGSRLLLTIACLTVTLGSFLLIVAPNIWFAFISRFLVGAGSAFAFVGCLKLSRLWLKPDSFPVVVGLTNLCAQLAAIMGNRPLANLVDTEGWKITVILISSIGVFITLLLATVIRNGPSYDPVGGFHRPSVLDFIGFLKKIVNNKQTWIIALYGCLIVSPIVAFGEFWGIHYLQYAFSLNRADAALLNSSIFVGIAVGGPTLGLLAKRYHHYLSMMRLATIIALCALSAVLFFDTLSYFAVMSLLFVYGMMSSNMLLCFTLVNKQYSVQHQATAIGFTNTVIMFGGAFFPVIVGMILDYITRFDPISTLTLHSTVDLKKALIILPVCLCLALLLTLFMQQKDKHKG